MVTVTTPAAGAVWACGSSKIIQWTAIDNIGGQGGVASISITGSNDNGVNWNPIVSGITNTGSYTWTVPNFPTVNYLIRVSAVDQSGNSGVGTSGVFNVADQTPPAITVNSPNGGESYQVGYNPLTDPIIKWTATDNVGVQKVDIYYSTNGGTNWIAISSGSANTGNYYWQIPNTPSSNCFVRIVAHDTSGNTAEDRSDAKFTIHT